MMASSTIFMRLWKFLVQQIFYITMQVLLIKFMARRIILCRHVVINHFTILTCGIKRVHHGGDWVVVAKWKMVVLKCDKSNKLTDPAQLTQRFFFLMMNLCNFLTGISQDLLLVDS